jgi:hypothetical protein
MGCRIMDIDGPGRGKELKKLGEICLRAVGALNCQ